MLEPALDAVVARGLDVPEQAAKGEQPVVIERLPVKDEHRIAIDGARQFRDCLGRQVRDEVKAADLAHEQGMKLPHLNGHRSLQLATLHSSLCSGKLIQRRHERAVNRASRPTRSHERIEETTREMEPTSNGLTLTGAGRSTRWWRTQARIGRLCVGAGDGALHAAVEAIAPEVDTVPAFVEQVARITAKAHMHHRLIAHFLDEFDGGY